MTTKLTKPVSREVEGVIISLTSSGIYLREKGRRTTYGPLPLAWLLQKAAQMEANATMQARKSRRVTRGLLTTRDPMGE